MRGQLFNDLSHSGNVAAVRPLGFDVMDLNRFWRIGAMACVDAYFVQPAVERTYYQVQGDPKGFE